MLAERYGASAHGLDASEEMLAVAREHVPPDVWLTQGRAESLPFADGSFERVLMHLVIHLVDSASALAEARRVLSAGRRLVIGTLDPAGVEEFWLSRFFPSYAEIDRRRFVAPQTLCAEIERSGFGHSRVVRFSERISYTRARALELLRGRFASSFALIPQDEYQEGLSRAERELADRMESTLRLLVVTASR